MLLLLLLQGLPARSRGGSHLVALLVVFMQQLCLQFMEFTDLKVNSAVLYSRLLLQNFIGVKCGKALCNTEGETMNNHL